MGGVSASVFPTSMTRGLLSLPTSLVAVIMAGVRPGVPTEPAKRPLAASTDKPGGKSVAAKVGRGVPVAAMVYCRGVPGNTPTTRAPLIVGASDAGAVEMVM